MFTGAAALAVQSNFSQSQDILYTLAADTGGKALLDYNDLSSGIVAAEKSITNDASDGKFRRVNITLNWKCRRQTRLPAGLLGREGVREVHGRGQGTLTGKRR
jgi:hypothetical protein